ncbi:hypothetical protein BDDG_11717 [Blastomyces dermatitidis ATCC 18188]|uniref:Uncharacterized protein n=1 Tax=Ajellomyces dermatitidis (strain ATCC 18188 / CBS 674.68) TaxID=653446 RepID=A0A0J9EK64_AJEDA|nr:hypothetical protein BDDG_11717 [Blastomyces dermatitidis ATCC 18188]
MDPSYLTRVELRGSALNTIRHTKTQGVIAVRAQIADKTPSEIQSFCNSVYLYSEEMGARDDRT